MIEYTPQRDAERSGRDFHTDQEAIAASRAPTLDVIVMPLRLQLLLMLMVLQCLASRAPAQAAPHPAEPMLSPTELRADLQQLRILLEKKHPAPYRYTSRERMHHWFDSVHTALSAPMSARAFLAGITTLYPMLGDGHTMFLPADDGLQHRYLPMEVLLQGDSLFVRCDGPPPSGVHAGDHVLSINGTAARDVVRMLMQRQIRDGHNTTYPAWILDRWWRPYFRFAFGEPASFEVRLRSPDGDERSVLLPALPMDSIGPLWRACLPEHPAAIELSWPDSGIAMLRVPSFDEDLLTNSTGSAAEQLRMAFEHIRARQVQHVVLDLRGNQGGDPALAKLLLAHLLSKPFTLVADGPASGTTRPVAMPFTGKLCTLMDGGCFSATGMVLAQLELHQRGMLMGEEAGGNRTVLSGSARTKVLKHSRIACTVPRTTWQLVHRPDDGHGVRPTHPVVSTVADRISNYDAVMSTALHAMRAAH